MQYCIHCMNEIEYGDKFCPFCGKSQESVTPAHHLMPGSMLNNKFIVGCALGEGGFGITYLCRDLSLDTIVAIKEYFPSDDVTRNNTVSKSIIFKAGDDKRNIFNSGKEKFLTEARTLSKLYSENGIVNVREYFEENDTAYIVMEYLNGKTLKSYIKEKGLINYKEALKILIPIMKSLEKVHQKGMIHRDISPDNIIISENCVKLIDFGAAKSFISEATKGVTVTLKEGYAPVEQYYPNSEQGIYTDIYALCATFYKCVTGKTPTVSVLRLENDILIRPSEMGIEIDRHVENAIMKGLSLRKEDRFGSISELIDALNGVFSENDNDQKTISLYQHEISHTPYNNTPPKKQGNETKKAIKRPMPTNQLPYNPPVQVRYYSPQPYNNVNIEPYASNPGVTNINKKSGIQYIIIAIILIAFTAALIFVGVGSNPFKKEENTTSGNSQISDSVFIPENAFTYKTADISGSCYVSASSATMRKGPNNSSELITSIAQNSKVTFSGFYNDDPNWILIEYSGQYGWVLNSQISNFNPKINDHNGDGENYENCYYRVCFNTPSHAGLNLRSESNSSSKKIAQLSEGSIFTVDFSKAKKNGYVYINICVGQNQYSGWILESYIERIGKAY